MFNFIKNFFKAVDRRCKICCEPITNDNIVYLPVDGSPVVGPLCSDCDLEFYTPKS